MSPAWAKVSPLVAELDRLATAGQVSTGRAESATIPGRDPLDNLKF